MTSHFPRCPQEEDFHNLCNTRFNHKVDDGFDGWVNSGQVPHTCAAAPDPAAGAKIFRRLDFLNFNEMHSS